MFCKRLDWGGQKFVGWIDGSNEGEEGMGKYDIQVLLLAIKISESIFTVTNILKTNTMTCMFKQNKTETFF